MTLQEQAANGLVNALVERHLGTAVAYGANGPVVSIQEHPEASVHFKRDQLGGLLVEYVFDGRPPVRLNYVPTAAAASELAQYVLEQIAGEGGGSGPAGA